MMFLLQTAASFAALLALQANAAEFKECISESDIDEQMANYKYLFFSFYRKLVPEDLPVDAKMNEV